MTANQVLIGVGLIIVLAVGSQVLASRLKLRGHGRLAPVTASGPPRSEPGDIVVVFCPAAEGP